MIAGVTESATEAASDSPRRPLVRPLAALTAFQLWLLVFLPLAVLYLGTVSLDEDKMSPDPVAAALPAWRIANFGDLNLDAWGFNNPWVVRANGRRVSNREPGIIFAGVPFYLAIGRNTDHPSLFPAAVAAAVYAAAAMAFLALVFRKLLSARGAVLAAFLAALGTSTWSVSADQLWPHGPDQLLLVLSMLALSREKHVRTGIAYGLAILIRTHLAASAAVVGIWDSIRTRPLKPALCVGIPSAIGLATLFWYTSHVYGHADVNAGYGGEFGGYPTEQLAHATNNYFVNWLGFFFSPERGIFVVTPFLLLLVPGLVRAWRVAPPWVRSSAVGGLAYIAIQHRINYFSGGSRFWGYRLAIETVTLCAPLLCLAWREWTALKTWRRKLFAGLATWSVGVQLIGATMFVAPPILFSPWKHAWLFDELFKTRHRHTVQAIGLVVVVLSVSVAVLPWPRAWHAQPAAPLPDS
jgi:alpha-1,2-mannosyltransferase